MPAKPGRGFFPKAHTNAGRKPSRLQAEANAADRRKGRELIPPARTRQMHGKKDFNPENADIEPEQTHKKTGKIRKTYANANKNSFL